MTLKNTRRTFNMNVQPTNKKEWAEFLLNLNLSLDDLTRAVNFNPLIFDMTVVASGGDGVHTINGPLQTITTNGIVTLDGNSHGGYRAEVIFKVGSAAISDLSLYLNGDLTVANYSRWLGYFGNSTANEVPTADARLYIGANTTSESTLWMDISISPTGRVLGAWRSTYSNFATTDFLFLGGWFHNATVANITRFDWITSQALGWGVGSRVRLWRNM